MHESKRQKVQTKFQRILTSCEQLQQQMTDVENVKTQLGYDWVTFYNDQATKRARTWPNFSCTKAELFHELLTQ